jgi:hypothetical protein
MVNLCFGKQQVLYVAGRILRNNLMLYKDIRG